MLPLELNSRLRCRWKDGEYYRCKVLERRIKPDLEPKVKAANDPAVVYEYYVHFSSSEPPGGWGGAQWQAAAAPRGWQQAIYCTPGGLCDAASTQLCDCTCVAWLDFADGAKHRAEARQGCGCVAWCVGRAWCDCVCLPVLCAASACAAVNRRMDQWVDTADFDLNTLEVQLEEVGPDGK